MRIREAHLTIIYKTGLYDSLKWGFSVPKKKIYKATSRNRIKRQMRAVIDNYIIEHPSLSDKPVAFFIIYSHDDLIPFDDLKTILIRLFNVVFYSNE